MDSPPDLEVEEASRAIMARLSEAWERGDGVAYASVFSEDAQYVSAPGERVYGRKSIAQSHQRVFGTIFKNSRLGREYPLSFRRIAPDVVLVEATGSVLFPGEMERNVAPNGFITLVLVRQGDVWQIVSFQNTPTGRFRKTNFIWRYFVSRIAASRAHAPEAPKHTSKLDPQAR
jgi:uncharacterized protein (TIGR02246 family)